jgi:hypothetical protein
LKDDAIVKIHPTLAKSLLIVLLALFVLPVYAGFRSIIDGVQHARQCQSIDLTPTVQLQNDVNGFGQHAQQSKLEACALAGSSAIACGEVSVGYTRDEINSDAASCAVNAYRSNTPFLYKTILYGIDTRGETWTVGTPDGKLYFIDTTIYGSGGSAVITTTTLCSNPMIEMYSGTDIETIYCDTGSIVKTETFEP